MESVPYKQMRRIVEKIDATIKADDPRLRRTVRVVVDDGSEFIIDSSFLLTYGEWLIIISEHYPPRFFPMEDIEHHAQYEYIFEIDNVTEEVEDFLWRDKVRERLAGGYNSLAELNEAVSDLIRTSPHIVPSEIRVDDVINTGIWEGWLRIKK